MFSILIPSFNNLKYLKLCLHSIKINSKFDHQIIIHVNEGSDGTLEYVKQNFTTCEMKEKGEKLSLVFKEVDSASSAITICKSILGK